MSTQVPITYQIYQAERAIHQQMNKALQDKGFPILIEQWPVLSEIFFTNGITQQDLADRIKKNKTTLTRILNTLEKNGLIRREVSKIDRRKKNLFYTEKANGLRPKVIEVLKAQSEFILQGFDKETERGMRKGLGIIFRNLTWEFNFSENKYSFK